MSSGDERFFVRSAGRVTGPFTRDRLTELKRLGRLPGHCELSRDRVRWESPAALFGEPTAAPTGGGGGGGTADPINNPPVTEQWYYTDPTGNRIGPVSRAQVAALAAAGAADGQTLVWKDGLPDWQPYLTHFPAVAAPTAGAGGYALAEVGGLLLMIAGWLWVAALAGLTVTWAASWTKGELITAALFLPGILGLGHLLVNGCGMAFLLTAPGRHGVRAALITAMAFGVVHLFLLPFVGSDWGGGGFGTKATGVPTGMVWVPVVSGLPATTLLATVAVNGKAEGVGWPLFAFILLGLVEAGRVTATLFAARGLCTQARAGTGRGMSLSAVISLGAVLFAVNLGVLSAVSHIVGAVAAGGPAAQNVDKVLWLTLLAVYLAVTSLAVLYGLAVTFTYTGFKRANRAGWL